MYNKITNPLTNRKVNVSLIKNYFKLY